MGSWEDSPYSFLDADMHFRDRMAGGWEALAGPLKLLLFRVPVNRAPVVMAPFLEM